MRTSARATPSDERRAKGIDMGGSGQEQSRATWAWWGVGAGGLGLLANLGGDAQSALTEAQRAAGAGVVEHLSRGTYHLGVLAGLGAFACLVLTAAGWRRWAHDSGQRSLAVHAIASALTASAGALLLAYGLRGGLAEYLAGGINDRSFPPEGLFVLFMIDDTAPWLGWWGVLVAAGCVAWAALFLRLLPVWLGVLSALVLLPPVAVLGLSGAAALAGVIAPAWLAVCSLALALRRLPVAEPSR